MEQAKIQRINELARKAKAGELTPAETQERAKLRKEYINAFKTNVRSTLENVRVETKDGDFEPLRKLTPEEAAKKKDHHHEHGENCGCGHHHHGENCGCGHHHDEDAMKH